MAQKHQTDISGLLAPLRKQRAEWLKVAACPVCGKPSHKNVYQNTKDVYYSHFENGVYVGSHQVCLTMREPDLSKARQKPQQSYTQAELVLPA